MWTPNDDILSRIVYLFKENEYNEKIFTLEFFNKKLNDRNLDNELPNYLIFIINSKDTEFEYRNISLEILKTHIQYNYFSISKESLKYLQENMFNFENDLYSPLRKNIPRLVNMIIKIGGYEDWPDLFEIVLNNIDDVNHHNLVIEANIKIIKIFLQEESISDKEKMHEIVAIITKRLMARIGKYALRMRNSDDIDEIIRPLNMILEIIFKIFDNFQDVIIPYLEYFSTYLLEFRESENFELRTIISECLIAIIKIKFDIFLKNYEDLFSFFFDNYRVEHYKMNFTASKFLLYLLEEKQEIFINNKSRYIEEPPILNVKISTDSKYTTFNSDDKKNNKEFNNVSIHLEKYLKEILPYILHYMRISQKEIQMVEIKSNESSPNNSSNSIKNKKDLNSMLQKKKLENLDLDEDLDYLEYFVYNPYWTLRKCSSKLIDKISCIFPRQTLNILKPFLESDLQCSDWIKKERSILALGAIAIGSYEYLKPHLNTLVSFIIEELQNPNKLIRAITCWTLSRFTNFILNDNNSTEAKTLFKDYFLEIQKRFLDVEEIVQEAASSAFAIMLTNNKEIILPYITDIIKITTTIFTKFSETRILILHDITNLLIKNYEEIFQKLNVVEDLIKCIIMNLCEKINMKDQLSIIYLLDIIPTLIKANGYNIHNYVTDFVDLSLETIKMFYQQYKIENNTISETNKDLINKCLDLVSVVYTICPNDMIDYRKKNLIVENIFLLLEINDYYIKHLLIAIIGEIARIDNQIYINGIKMISAVLINNLELNEYHKLDQIEIDKLSVCNNSCWTLGLLSLTYSDYMVELMNPIMKKLIKILKHSKLNKSLAQNIAICIGRCSLISPQIISGYLDQFLKQFCLSLRNIKNSNEKKEAFTGLCKGILFNPNGVINHFAFFCDAICLYDDAPIELESLFQNLIFSYKNTLKEKWFDYFGMFPEKLKKKMTERFISN